MDVRQIIRAVEAHEHDYIESIVAAYTEDDDDLEEFAYYLVMQTRGHGVAWSDDHDGELWTPPWDSAMWYVDNWCEDDDAAGPLDDNEEEY